MPSSKQKGRYEKHQDYRQTGEENTYLCLSPYYPYCYGFTIPTIVPTIVLNILGKHYETLLFPPKKETHHLIRQLKANLLTSGTDNIDALFCVSISCDTSGQMETRNSQHFITISKNCPKSSQTRREIYCLAFESYITVRPATIRLYISI